MLSGGSHLPTAYASWSTEVDRPYHLYPSAPQASELAEIFRKLWLHKRVIAACAIIAGAVAVVAVSRLTPTYTANTQVLVGIPDARLSNIQSVVSNVDANTVAVQSEVHVVRSRRVASRVVDWLRLDNEPEFNAALRPKSGWPTLGSIRRAAARLIKGPEDAAPPTDAERRKAHERQRQRVINALLGRLEVAQVGRSRVLDVRVTSRNPERAAEVANAVSTVYIEDQLRRKSEMTELAEGWLKRQIGELRQQVVSTEQKVEEYRRRHGLFQAKASTVTAQQLSELNTQLILAQAQMAQAKARLSQARTLMRSRRAGDTVPEVLNSPLIQSLKRQQADVGRRAAELSAKYGPKHPKIRNINAEIRDVGRKIRREIAKIVAGLSNQSKTAKARYEALSSNLETIKMRMGKTNEKLITLRALEREAEATRQLFQTFLQRSKETAAQRDVHQANAMVISRAAVPESPSFPPTKLLIFVALLGGTLIGILLAFVIEQLRTTFRSGEEVETLTGLPTLAVVPASAQPSRAASDALAHPTSPYNEAIRRLQTTLSLSAPDDPPKVVMVTSAAADEGKSEVCLSLARMAAAGGARVIVLDCDWRKPHLHRAVGESNDIGLSDFLTAEATVQEVIHSDDSGAHLVFGGSSVPAPDSLLCSENMRQFLGALNDYYDLILLDTPPVLVGAEVFHLCRMVDKTVFVVRWNHTRRKLAMEGLKRIMEVGGNLAGIVLSQVDAKRYQRHGDAELHPHRAATRA